MVTVLMTVYNSEKFIKKAVESILAQSYTKFEFLIIDDGSTDKSLEILKKFKDRRIKILKNEKNMGLIYSLNRGIEEASGEYIFRFDSDDICNKERLKIQLNYLKKNKDVVLLGSNAKIFVSKFKLINKKTKLPEDTESIKCKLLFESCFIHPSVVLKKEILTKYNLRYSIDEYGVEDYGLWVRIANLKKLKINNLKERLIDYRILSTSITQVENKNLESRIVKMKKIYKIALNPLIDKISEEELSIHAEICLANILSTSYYTLKFKEEWLLKLREINKEKKYFDLDKFSVELAGQYFKSCVKFGDYNSYKKSEFYLIINFSKINFIFEKYKNKIREKINI